MEVIEHDESFSPILAEHVIEIVQALNNYEVFSVSDVVNQHGGVCMRFLCLIHSLSS